MRKHLIWHYRYWRACHRHLYADTTRGRQLAQRHLHEVELNRPR